MSLRVIGLWLVFAISLAAQVDPSTSSPQPSAPCTLQVSVVSYEYGATTLKTTWVINDSAFPTTAKLVQKLKRDDNDSLLESSSPAEQSAGRRSRSFSTPLTDLSTATKLRLWLESDPGCTVDVPTIVIDHSVFLRASRAGDLEAQVKRVTNDKDALNKQYDELKGKFAESEAAKTGTFPKAIEFKGVELKSDRFVILHFFTVIPGRIRVSATGDTAVSPQSSPTFQNEHFFKFKDLLQGGTYNFKAEVLDSSGSPLRSPVSVDSTNIHDLTVQLLADVPPPNFNIVAIAMTAHSAECKLLLSRESYVQITASELVEAGLPVHVEPVVVGKFDRDAWGIVRTGKPTGTGEQTIKVPLSPGKLYTLEFRVEDVYGNKGSRTDAVTTLFAPAKTPPEPPTFGVADAVTITLNPLGSKFAWKATRAATKGEVQVSVRNGPGFRWDATPDDSKTTLTANVPYTEFLKIMNVTETPTLTIRMWDAEGDKVEQNLRVAFEVPSKAQLAKVQESQQSVSNDLLHAVDDASNPNHRMNWKDWLKLGLGIVVTFAK